MGKTDSKFVPLATQEETKAFLQRIEHLRHSVFTTSRRFADGRSEQWAWNVTEGYELAHASGRKSDAFDPAKHGLDLEFVVSRYPDFDVRYAINEADLSKPVLFVPTTEVVAGETVGAIVLIDGWHRLFRSIVEAMETGKSCPLLAFILTEDEEKAIRIAPVVEPGSMATGAGTRTLREIARNLPAGFR